MPVLKLYSVGKGWPCGAVVQQAGAGIRWSMFKSRFLHLVAVWSWAFSYVGNDGRYENEAETNAGALWIGNSREEIGKMEHIEEFCLHWFVLHKTYVLSSKFHLCPSCKSPTQRMGTYVVMMWAGGSWWGLDLGQGGQGRSWVWSNEEVGSPWVCWILPEPLLPSWGDLGEWPSLVLTEDELCTWNFSECFTC